MVKLRFSVSYGRHVPNLITGIDKYMSTNNVEWATGALCTGDEILTDVFVDELLFESDEDVTAFLLVFGNDISVMK